MTRPGPVVAVSVVQLFGSVCFLVLALIMALGAVVTTMALAGAATRQPASAMWIAVGFVLALTGWGIATALGLLWMKLWALISTLLFACGLIGGGIGAMASVLNPMPMAAASAGAATAVVAVHVAQIFGGLVLLGLGIWWVAYFAGARTRASFFAARGDGAAPRLPVSLNLMGWMMLAGGGLPVDAADFGAAGGVFFGTTHGDGLWR